MLPVLPPELHRDILFWAVGPHARGSLPPGSPFSALATDREREKDRRELRDRRMTAIQVCRAWKVSPGPAPALTVWQKLTPAPSGFPLPQREARKYLYRDPHLPTLHTFASLAQSLALADKMWDDLRSSPYSLPGAFVQVLDLSHIASSSTTTSDASFNPWRFTSTLSTILPLVPSLVRLVLPAPESYMLGATTLLRLLNKADFPLASLRELENVPVFANGVVTHQGLDPVVELLLQMPGLQKLGIVGGGALDFEGDGQTAAGPDGDGAGITPVDLPKLTTLSLRGIPSGLLLQTLLASPLPALTTLEVASYYSHPGEQTTALVRAHGFKLASLAFLHLPDFPALHFPLPPSTLDDCPHLVSLAFHVLPNHQPPLAADFFARPALHLRHLTLPRPPRTSSTTYTDLVAHFCATPNLPALQTLSISPGFSWLPTPPSSHPAASIFSAFKPPPLNSPPAVSAAATHAGLNGIVRQYAVRLGRRAVQVLDARGRGCPGLVRVEGSGEWREAREVGRGWKGSMAAGGWRERRRSADTEDGEESEGGG